MPTLTLDELAAIQYSAGTITYDSAGANTLTLEGVSHAWAQRLGWNYGERITITTADGVATFSGIVTQGVGMSASGGNGRRCTLSAASDWYLLENIPYLNTNEDGVAILGPRIDNGNAPTLPIATIVATAFSAARDWPGSPVTVELECTLQGSAVPINSTGGTSCGAIMQAAMEWNPDAVIRDDGETLHIDNCTTLGAVTLSAESDHITDVSLVPRPDLILPAAALIGAQHYSIGGDPRQPGSFIYCVPRPAESEGSPASDDKPRDKTVILGLDLPPRATLNEDRANATGALRPVDQVTHELIAHAFPAFDALGPGQYHAGPPLVSVLPLARVRPQPTPGRLTDPDAEDAPANYDASFLTEPDQPHIHIEGRFPASARASRNISGLKWCRATIRIIVAVDHLPATLTREAAESLFPGTKRSSTKTWNYAELTITCNLINSGYRAVKGLRPLNSDPAYTEPPAASPDYIGLLTDYYNASQTLYHEGSLTLLEPTRSPASLIGRRIRISGMAADWAGMNAVCRTVSYDIKSRRMTLTLGPRGVLGFDQRLERQTASYDDERNRAFTAPLVDTADPEQAERAEEELLIDPNIEAASATNLTGQVHVPFSGYRGLTDNGDPVWTYQGGTYQIGPHTTLTIPTTTKTIIAGQVQSQELQEPGGGIGPVQHRVYRITRNGQKVWTYDVTQTIN